MKGRGRREAVDLKNLSADYADERRLKKGIFSQTFPFITIVLIRINLRQSA
jgi:hypothetical protein